MNAVQEEEEPETAESSSNTSTAGGRLGGDSFDTSTSSTIVSILLIGISAFLTGLNLFNKIGKFAGAGSLVPITGFANSIVSPAMEYKSEGYVMGVGGKMFTVAGPVLVFGISASILVGIVYLIFNTQAITLV